MTSSAGIVGPLVVLIAFSPLTVCFDTLSTEGRHPSPVPVTLENLNQAELKWLQQDADYQDDPEYQS